MKKNFKKKSRLKSALVATGATIKDHKEEIKTFAIVVMGIVIAILLMRKPETVYQEVPVEVVKEIIVEVPVEQEQQEENVRNKNNKKDNWC